MPMTCMIYWWRMKAIPCWKNNPWQPPGGLELEPCRHGFGALLSGG